MATVPLSGTNIRLLSGVPFSNDYKTTRWFDTVTDQTNYFSSKTIVHSMTQATFQRIEGKNFIAVNESIDDLWGTNYIMFQNTSYNSKWFYAFVTKLEYKQTKTTYVHFEIDVFQTWKFSMNFKPSYVVREHCKLWNSDGSPVVNTVDEGLNYGTEYDNVNVQQYTPHDGYKWLVILSKNTMHLVGEGGIGTTPHPSVIGSPTPLTVYLLPFKDSNTVPNVLDKDGDSVILTKPTEVLQALYLMTVSVNNIVSLYVTDYPGLEMVYTPGNNTFSFPLESDNTQVNGVKITDGTNECNVLHVEKADHFVSLLRDFGNKYDGYNTVKESKLLMHPYTQLVLDDFKGNRVSIKNEYIQTSNLKILAKGSLGTSNKTSYGVQNYNYLLSSLGNALSDESALINSDPNDVPIITDMLSAFLQGNRNSLHVQRNQINFNGVTDILGSGIGMMASALSGNVAGAGASAMGMVKGAGSTVFAMQGMNAKLKDISNTPPSISKMGSNSSYTIGNEYDGVYIIKKQIKAEYIKKLEDFFNMYGYKVNEVKIPNFHTRQYWNYVQTSSCIITGNFNNEDLNELKAIFDNGITLWHTDNFDYTLNNEVV